MLRSVFGVWGLGMLGSCSGLGGLVPELSHIHASGIPAMGYSLKQKALQSLRGAGLGLAKH